MRKLSMHSVASETKSEDAKRIAKLTEDNKVLRSQIFELKTKYEQAIQERDSLKLAVQLVSKDFYSLTKEKEARSEGNTSPKSYTETQHANLTTPSGAEVNTPNPLNPQKTKGKKKSQSKRQPA